jgi:hypothetical protein
MRTASANPSVAMARKTPRRCIVGRPRTTAASAPTAIPIATAISRAGTSPTSSPLGARLAPEKAPRAANPAWPRLS